MENAEKAGNDPRTIITRVLDWIKDKINAIRRGTGIGSRDDLAALEKAQKLWQDMYDVATARQNEKMEGKEVKRFDKQGNPVDGDGKLIVEKTNSVDELSDDDFTNPSHSVELPKIPDNVDKAIGAKGKPVIIKKNIFEKNARDHADLTPEQSREIFNAALYRPDLYGQNQMATRPYNYVVISTKEADGKNKLVLLEVNNGKDNVEIVHWHYIRDKALETLKRQAEREGGRILILPSDASEEAGGLSSRTHDLSSIGKDTDSSANAQGKIGESGLVSDEERVQYYREEFDPLRKAGFSGASVERLKKARAFVEEELVSGTDLDFDPVETARRNSEMRRSEQEGAYARLSVREAALRDALVDKMRNAGMDVSTDWKEGQRVLDEINGRVTLSKEQKKILDTATMASEIAQANKATAVSSTSGAKVLKKLESLKEKLGKLSSNRSKTILGDISEALKSEDTAPDRREGSSYYKTFVTENGILVTIRISNHNATVSNFDANNEKDGISIVISNHPDKGINNDGDAHIEEFFYSKAALSRAYGKPLADMVGALSDAVRYGRFKDPTGIAIPHEVNAEKVREHRAYHGSSADFDMFDHSHMGEGEGAQAYGWGSYLTEVEGIGRTYARSAAAGNNRNNVELAEAERRLDEAERVERQTLSRIRDAEERLIQLERTIEVLQTDISEYTRRRRELVAQHGEGSVQVENFDFVDGEMLEEDKTRLKMLKEESLPETKADLEEFKSDLEQARQTVKVLERKLDEIEKSRPILYSVEIPDDNGSNYLYYEKPVSQDLQAKAAEGLKARGFEETTLRNGHTAYVKGASQVVFYEGQKGADFYEELAIGFADELGSAGKRTDSEGDRMASEFLHELGVIGVKYPAEFRSGGRNDGKHNFVMFNEGDMKIVDKARFFRTRNGDAYGFTLNGKIFLDPSIATSETAVHEYSHLWAQALRKGNADEWRNVTGLMKDSPVWNEVRGLYPELRSEDEIAESRERDVKEQFDRTRQRGIDTADRILDDATATDKQGHQRMTDVIREVTRIDGLRKAGKETVRERVRSIADTLTEMIPATDEFTRGEVKRLIGKIDKAMDVKDVKRNVREAVNIVLKSVERDVDAETMRLRKTKGKRLDADSQLKQGQLDLKGQHVLDEFNRVADDVAVDLDQLEQQYSGEMGNMDLSEFQCANAADKLDGVKLAQLYRKSVKEKDQNISELNEMKRAEEEKIYNFKKRLVFDADGNVVKNKRTGEVRTETVKTPVIQSVISNSFWGCN